MRDIGKEYKLKITLVLIFALLSTTLIYAASSKEMSLRVPMMHASAKAAPKSLVLYGQGMKIYREGIVVYIGKAVRPGVEGEFSVKFFEIYDAQLDPSAQGKIEEAVETKNGKIILLSREEMILGKTIGGAICIAEDNAPAIIEGFERLTAGEREKIKSRLRENASYGNWRGKVENVEEVRVSAASLIRIKIKDRYLLMRYKKANEDGSWRYIPLGGALQYDEKGRKILENIGAKDFEGASDELLGDLRFRLPVANLGQFENWFNERQGRETDPVRELKEEIIKELGLFTQEEFDLLIKIPTNEIERKTGVSL
ncbi:MAG: hypothetical protein NTX47_00590 [Candidatus Omnitrophica bacterium]|nr:hypothetical protein [Candidatus Omnitrophota bacterium]